MNMNILNAAVTSLRQAWPDAKPAMGIVLGSGWREVSSAFRLRQAVRYAHIPGLGSTQVAGHDGQLHWAEHNGREIFVFLGRRHWYEGAGWEPIAIPVYVLKSFGASSVLLTNSAGGVRADLKPGDLMAIDDHINAMGVNPLSGPHAAEWGASFPDMSEVYSTALQMQLDEAARRSGIALHHGVYLAAAGPSYETPAEIKAFRALGADAVGMSTAPEAILAHAAGLRVAGVSCITNAAAAAGRTLSHAEVLAAAAAAVPGLKSLIQEFVAGVAGRRF